jgi:hypothetical protein
VQIHAHWRIEAPRNRFSRSTFRLKLGRKAARGLGLGGSAAAIYSHSQERRDLFALSHALRCINLRVENGRKTPHRSDRATSKPP